MNELNIKVLVDKIEEIRVSEIKNQLTIETYLCKLIKKYHTGR